MLKNEARPEQWKDLKSEIQKHWIDLSSDEIENTHGLFTSLSDLLRRRYGLRQSEAAQRLFEMINGKKENLAEGYSTNTEEDDFKYKY